MRYEDFALHIRSTKAESQEAFEVLARSSLAGEGRGKFHLPAAWSAAERLEDFARLVRAGFRGAQRLPDRLTVTARLGEILFSSLLGDIRNLYDFCRGVSMSSGDRDQDELGIRLRLHFDPTDTTSLTLHSLPWEVLRCPKEASFLGLDRRRSIVRHLDLPRSIEVRRFQLPLRVLVVSSSPTTLPWLDADSEQRAIERWWALQDDIDVAVIERATFHDLTQSLREGPFDVLHFIGHGDFDSHTGEGNQFFETENREAEAVTASRLFSVFQARLPPSLVVLNACRSARLVAQSPESGIHAGLPAAFLQLGIPAVVAMQFSISDGAALEFSKAFYRSLAHGEGIEEAVSEGRNAIHLADCDAFEWVTPSLYLRGPATTTLLELKPLRPALVSLIPSDPPASLAAPKRLHEFQRDLYGLFGNLKIQTVQDYSKLNGDERALVSREIVNKIIGLGSKVEDLLELRHMNARFPSKLPLHDPSFARSLDALHRQCALYADHSLVCFPPIRLRPAHQTTHEPPALGEESIALFLQHKDLIETGRMSVVPEMVQVVGEKYQCLFDVRRLDTVEVDLEDGEIASVFLEKGKVFQQVGAMTFRNPEGMGLRLPEILEVEERYRSEFETFQRYLRTTLLAVNPEGQSRALSLALRAVDAGIRELDGKYQALKRRSATRAVSGLASGALAVVIYSTGTDVAPLLASAFASASLSSLVNYIPDVRLLDDEIRRSPFFVPWLVASGKQSL